MPPRDFTNFTGKPDATNERDRSIAGNRQNVFIDRDVDMPEPTAGLFFAPDSSAGQYLKFERERTRPAADLLAGVPMFAPNSCIDLGCGPGNSTELLVRRFPDAAITALDRSTDVLAAAKRRLPQVHFQQADLTVWKPDQPWDLIFANAVLQLLPNHEALFPWLASLLTPGGYLAAQMPNTLQEPAHVLMRMVAADGPWSSKLMPVAKSRRRIGTIEDYYGWLTALCGSIDLWHTTYVHPLESVAEIVEWMMGSGLRPFLNLLEDDQRQIFLERYKAEIAGAYPSQPDGKVLLRFPTLFILARKTVSKAPLSTPE
jgi:trans-aconitate 2-methyltransferase